jgi:hypothetical protein
VLRVYIGSEIFFLRFGLGRKSWIWKVALDEGATLTVIRRPLNENPIKPLLEAAKYFGLLVI